MLTDEQFSQYSDLHKDVYGFRPRDWRKIVTREDFDDLIEYSKIVFEQERQERKRAAEEFTAMVRDEAKSLGVSTQQYIEWQIRDNYNNDKDFYLYEHNLSIYFDLKAV